MPEHPEVCRDQSKATGERIYWTSDRNTTPMNLNVTADVYLKHCAFQDDAIQVMIMYFKRS